MLTAKAALILTVPLTIDGDQVGTARINLNTKQVIDFILWKTTTGKKWKYS